MSDDPRRTQTVGPAEGSRFGGPNVPASLPRFPHYHDDEKQHHEEAIRRIQAEYDCLQNRIDLHFKTPR